LVDNINTLSKHVDHINHLEMKKRPPRQRAALIALLSLLDGLRQAMRLQLQNEGASAAAPMLLRILLLCQQQPGITQQGIVQQTGRDKGQVARMVKELMAAGLMSREAHPDDRRSHCLRPTEAGLKALEHFEAAEVEVAARVFGDLSSTDLSALTQQFDRLRARLDSGPHCPG